MANEERLAILQQGVAVWNTWWEEHPNVEPDLARAGLAKTNLRGVNLQGTDLRRGDLTPLSA
jgi:uncharacterized protein YjbI with pentapeptide repeats